MSSADPSIDDVSIDGEPAPGESVYVVITYSHHAENSGLPSGVAHDNACNNGLARGHLLTATAELYTSVGTETECVANHEGGVLTEPVSHEFVTQISLPETPGEYTLSIDIRGARNNDVYAQTTRIVTVGDPGSDPPEEPPSDPEGSYSLSIQGASQATVGDSMPITVERSCSDGECPEVDYKERVKGPNLPSNGLVVREETIQQSGTDTIETSFTPLYSGRYIFEAIAGDSRAAHTIDAEGGSSDPPENGSPENAAAGVLALVALGAIAVAEDKD